MNFQTARNKTSGENYQESEKEKNKTGSRFNDLFNRSWEVFVIKWDRETEKYIGKVACCALEPV